MQKEEVCTKKWGCEICVCVCVYVCVHIYKRVNTDLHDVSGQGEY